MKHTFLLKNLLFFLLIFSTGALAQTLTRGPYLQMGNQTGVTIRWRTNVASNSRVTWGTVFGTYPNIVDDLTSTTEHIVRITGLSADTKYYYTIGSTSTTLQATNTNYVLTMPPAGSTRKLRFLAIGDCGNASTNQIDTKNAALSYIGSNDLDGLLSIGDNAYSSGLDNEFQAEFFDIYKNDLFKYCKLYTVPGNHDYGNSSANTGVRNNAYYNSFTVPSAAECGGTASGTEAYYSYDIGNVHFVGLDSYGKEDANTTKLYDTTGAQCVWLKNDLAANTKQWVVVYFHHPPYTKTSHNSDTETGDLMLIRERFIRILERYGVDLVLCGHSHGYERSYLLKNYYNTPAAPLLDANFNAALHTATGNTQNAKYDGTANSCAYTYNSGKFNHGSVYIVSGSAGQLLGSGAAGGYPHDAMYYSNIVNGGSFYFEVDSNRLDAKFISYSGTGAGVTPVIRDQFTLFKDVKKKQTINVTQNTPSILTASWRGNYSWPNNGSVTTQSVTVPNNTAGTFTYYVNDNTTGPCVQDTFVVVVSGVVPVKLLSFDAALISDRVSLQWATAEEINNKYFTLEKSADGITYTVLGRVNAAGSLSSTTHYNFTDNFPYNGITYYRLSQTNMDGAVTYFDVKKIHYQNYKNFHVAVVNTAAEQIAVSISASSGNMQMQVLDIMGRELLHKEIKLINNNTTENIQLKKGIYVLVLTNSNGERITQKVIVR